MEDGWSVEAVMALSKFCPDDSIPDYVIVSNIPSRTFETKKRQRRMHAP